MKRVVAIGELLIDFIPHQTACPLDEVTGFDRVAGGAPANVAIAVSRLGGDSAMISQVGEDAFGTHLIKNLEAAGVDTSAVFRTNRANTALAFVSLDANGDRQFSFYRNPSADLFLDESQISPALLEGAGVLHFCSVDLVDAPVRGAHRRAIQLAKEAGAIVCFDPNVRLPLWSSPEDCQKAIREFLPLADIVKLSDEEVEFVTGVADMDAAARGLLEGGAGMVVVTLGADGAAVFTKAGKARCGVVPGPVADTTGAGDSFIGSLLYQLCRDDVTPADLAGLEADRLAEYLRFSSHYAALTVAQKGAVMATLEQVQHSMEG